MNGSRNSCLVKIATVPNAPPIAELQQTLSASRLLCFDVPADRAIALRTRLQSDIDEHALSMLYSAAHRMYFARNDEHYWAFHNCNHLTADWLRDLGCKVDGFVLFSNFEMATNPENPPPNR